MGFVRIYRWEEAQPRSPMGAAERYVPIVAHAAPTREFSLLATMCVCPLPKTR